VFAWDAPAFELSEGGESRTAQGLWVTGDFFRTLDVRPVIGRVLTADDDRRGCASPPAVISYGFWQRAYGGSPSALGRSLTLDGHAYDIVGVTPAPFFGVEVGSSYDVAVPLCAEPLTRGAQSVLDRRDGWFLAAIGRISTRCRRRSSARRSRPTAPRTSGLTSTSGWKRSRRAPACRSCAAGMNRRSGC
jgi:hypothetical protein